MGRIREMDKERKARNKRLAYLTVQNTILLEFGTGAWARHRQAAEQYLRGLVAPTQNKEKSETPMESLMSALQWRGKTRPTFLCVCVFFVFCC